MIGPPDLQPVCRKCRRRHRSALPCWGGRYSQKIRVMVFELYGNDCWICSQPGADTADHVHPRARGGLDNLENMRPAHRYCNTGRGAGDPDLPARRPPRITVETSERWSTDALFGDESS